MSFDEEFVELANKYDVVLIGGGNFWELWVKESKTGTTIDISPSVLQQIDPLVVFYSLGVDPYMGVPEKNAEKFRSFLAAALEDDGCLLTVRNDGSQANVAEYIDESYADQLTVVPDGGFFTSTGDGPFPSVADAGRTIAVNVVRDMMEERFEDGQAGFDRFADRFARLLDELLEQHDDINIVFIPHIYSDLGAIDDIVRRMDDMHRRKRVTSGPYLHGWGAEKHVFGLYEQCDLALGMRFHANVCALGRGTPTIGLNSHFQKVGDLYDEIGIPERSLRIDHDGYVDELRELIQSSLKKSTEISSQYRSIRAELHDETTAFHADIDSIV
jgi:polysaccharide pyruvyl transferase WcaK-like protein